jgi:hypothetical protein
LWINGDGFHSSNGEININQIDTGIRQLLQLLQVVIAINDTGIKQRRGFCHAWIVYVAHNQRNGEGGIRTLGTLLEYGALAKRCFRPLSHLTSLSAHKLAVTLRGVKGFDAQLSKNEYRLR